jgi:plastocyanin
MDNINMSGGPKNKKLFIILGLVVIVAIIVVAALMTQKDEESSALGGESSNSLGVKSVSEDIPADAQAYVPDNVVLDEEGEAIIPEALVDAMVAVVGANPITTDGTVVTPAGEAVQNDVMPMSPKAPKQTSSLAVEELPVSVVKLDVSAAGFEPAEISVKAGAPVTIAITSADDFAHVFIFDDSVLSAIAIGVPPHETSAITFNSPVEAGEYTFHCDVPGHAARGEVGKMIVK